MAQPCPSLRGFGPVQVFEAVFCSPDHHSRDARVLERQQTIHQASILAPGQLYGRVTLLPAFLLALLCTSPKLPTASLCPLLLPAVQVLREKVVAKPVTAIHQALQRNLGRDQGTMGTGDLDARCLTAFPGPVVEGLQGSMGTMLRFGPRWREELPWPF